MGHPTSRALFTVFLFGVVLTGLLVATGPPVPAAADPTTERGRMVLVLDSSGSMAEQVSGGTTRIEAARQGLTQVVDALPADAQVGMRVYGATVFEKSQPGACEDSQLVVPLGQGNRDALKAAVAAYQPYGETPIGYALRQAAGDVGPTGPRTVLLVSDGEDTCAPPDPCVVAAELRAQGIDLRIDVVGLDVGADAKAQLQCIAEAGGGEYYDAANAADLATALDTVSTRAVRAFELGGQPVDGTPQAAGAPRLEPGTYVDELAATGQELFYEVPRSASGSTLWASATLQNAAFVGTVALRTYVGERLCGNGLDQEVGVLGTADIISAATSTWRPDPEDSCSTAERISVRVSHQADELVGQPFELRVSEEPPVTDVALLPAKADSGALQWSPMPGGPAGPLVSGGTSLGTAVPLQPGLHTLELVPGETQVFSVTLGWGQRLQTLATLAPRTGALADLSDDPLIGTKVFGPDRGATGPYLASQGFPATTLGNTDDLPSVAAAETLPVTYQNRGSNSGNETTTSRAGDYFLVVSLSADRTGDTYVAPGTLEVAVVGTPVDPPSYAVAGVDPTAGPTETTTATPTATSSATAGTVATDDDAGGLPTWLLPLAAIVLGFAVGAVLLRRRARGAQD